MHGRRLINKHLTHGFTLVELVAVIVVMGIVGAAFVAPLIYDTGHMKLEGEAKRLLADVRYTQSLSMFRNARYRLDFSNSNCPQNYNCYAILTPAGGSFNYFASGGTKIKLESGTTLSVSSTSKYLVFDGLGAPALSSNNSGSGGAATSNTIITLTHNGRSKTVTVTPVTGLVALS